MTRTARICLRVIVIGFALSVSLGASALPLSPKWMKSSGTKVDQPRSGAFDDNNDGPDTGGVPQELPVPASLWLMLIGAAGMALAGRKKD